MRSGRRAVARGRQVRGRGPDPGHRQADRDNQHGGCHDGGEGPGMARCSRGNASINVAVTATTSSAGRAATRSAWVITCQAAVSGDRPAVWQPQCRRHLLQENDGRDTEREALDHRPRMNVTARPSPLAPAARTSRPARIVTSATLPTP